MEKQVPAKDYCGGLHHVPSDGLVPRSPHSLSCWAPLMSSEPRGGEKRSPPCGRLGPQLFFPISRGGFPCDTGKLLASVPFTCVCI